MPGPKAQRIRLAPPVRDELQGLARSTASEHRWVQRARIILRAADGASNAEIAREVGCHVDTVRKWRARFACDSRVQALQDGPRSGRPARVPVNVRCELIKLACARPEAYGARCRERWTQLALADALARETGWTLSRSEIGRILRCEDFRPHHMKRWLHSPDPDFRPKVKRICDLYRNPPAGATVLCVDEKTSIQALQRAYSTRLPAPGRTGRYEFEYIRHGTSNLLAAFDIGTGRVFGRCYQRRTARNLISFMERLAARIPTGDVYIVWDNLNIHFDGREQRWAKFNERHGNRFHFIYTPLHASWLNQIEIWFSILQRRILRDGDFDSVANLNRGIMGYIAHWNRYEAHPFHWTFRGRFRQDEARRAA